MTSKKMYTVIESARRALRNWDMDKHNSRSRDYIDYAIGEAISLKEEITLANWSMYHQLMCQIEAYQHLVAPRMHRCIGTRSCGVFLPMDGMFASMYLPTKKWFF